MNSKRKLFLYVLILSITLFIFAIIYLRTDLFKTKEQLFWKNFLEEKDEIVNVLSNNDTKSYNSRLKNSYYIKEGNISIDCERNIFKPVNINIIEKGNKKEEYKNSLITLNYDNRNYNETTIINEENYFYIKNSIFNNDYLRIENNNLKQLAEKVGVNNTNIIPNKIKDIDYLDILTLSDVEIRHILKKYIPICRKYVNNNNYTIEKNIKFKNDTTENVAYKLQITEKELNDLLIDVLKELYNDNETLNLIINKIGMIDEKKEYYDIDNLKHKISELTTVLQDKRVDDKIFLSIIIYKKSNNVEKIEFIINNDRKISIENSDNNKIIIKQYDIKNKEIKINTIEDIIKTMLNAISEIEYSKEIINGDCNKVELIIKCNLGIERINIKYNYVEQIKNNVENIVRENQIKYIDLDKILNEDLKTIIEKVLKINTLEIGKNYL